MDEEVELIHGCADVWLGDLMKTSVCSINSIWKSLKERVIVVVVYMYLCRLFDLEVF